MSSEVPEGWERSLLGDVLRLEYGRALSATVREEGNVPVYGSNGVVGLHSTPLVPRKGIVVGRKGTAGSVTVTDGPFWPIDTAYYVEPQQEVEFDWLASMLKHARLSDLNESTGVPGLNRDKVYREAVLIPPLAEQRRIAEVLRSVDAAITAAEASFDQCHVTQSALLDLAFSSGEPTALGNICALIYRYPGFYGFEQREAGVPVIRGEHLRAGRVSTDWSNFYFVDPEFSQQFPKTILGLGDVVMSVRGTVGTAAVVDAAHVGSQISPNLIRLVADPKRLLPQLLFFAVQSAVSRIRKTIVNAQALPSINAGDLKMIEIALPSMDDQPALLAELESNTAATEEAARALRHALEVKRLLMSDLLTGRVRVPA